MTCKDFVQLLAAFMGPMIAVFVACIGWFATDHFTRRREWHQRMGNFRGALLYFRHAIAREGPKDINEIWKIYLEEVCDYHRELGKVWGDVRQHERFAAIADKLGNLQKDDVEKHVGPDNRDPITGRIDQLREIVDKWADNR